VHLAWVLGATRILLLGVDGYRLPQAGYLDGSRGTSFSRVVHRGCGPDQEIVEQRHLNWAADMAALKRRFDFLGVLKGPWPGPGVYNLSPRSRIDAWEKVCPEQALPCLAAKEGNAT